MRRLWAWLTKHRWHDYRVCGWEGYTNRKGGVVLGVCRKCGKRIKDFMPFVPPFSSDWHEDGDNPFHVENEPRISGYALAAWFLFAVVSGALLLAY